MMRAMTTPHEGELAQASLDGLYRWDAEQPGMSLTGTYRGRLLLTSRRLLFLSIGGSGLAGDLAMTALFGPLGAALARTPTSDLDLSALEREGSEAFRLESIASLEKVLGALGWARPPDRTPREHADQLALEGFGEAPLVAEIVDRYLVTRYGGGTLEPRELDRLRRAIRGLKGRRDLFAAAG